MKWGRIVTALAIANEARAVLTAPALARTAWAHAGEANVAMAALPLREQLALFLALGVALAAVIALFAWSIRATVRQTRRLFRSGT